MSDSARQRDIIRQTAGFVATELGTGWSVDPSWGGFGALLVGPDGARVIVRPLRSAGDMSYWNVDRVELAGNYPDGWTKLPGDVEHFRATVKRDRGPAVIARELVRRILPGYLPELERVTARLAASRDAASSQTRVRDELVALAPGGYTGTSEGTVRFATPGHGTWGDLRLNHDGTGVSELELRSVPVELARAVLELVRDHGDAARGDA